MRKSRSPLIPLLALPGVLALLLPLPTAIFAQPTPKLTRLTRDGGFKQHLCWSPDGKRFLLTRIHRGKMGLWTMSSDGSDLKPLLVPDPNTPHFDGHWSPDGKRITFVLDILRGTDGNLQINVAGADGRDSK